MRNIETLLYYPTVAVPSEWAKTALFNGYSIGSITPQNWYNSQLNEPILDPSFNTRWPQGASNYYLSRNEINELSSNCLFEKFDPNERDQYSNSFEENFIRIIESNGFKDLLNQSPKFSDIPIEEHHKQSWIHEDKISMNIIEYLVEKKLARKTPKIDRGMSYYIVDNTISDLYISLLAQNIADSYSDLSNPGILPSSEKIDHWRSLSNPNYSIKKQMCINIIVNGGALSPVPSTPIASIIDFRDEHKHECVKYQRKLFKTVKDISQACAWEDIPEVMQDTVREIQMDLSDLERNLEQLKIQCIRNVVFISIVPITSLGVSIMDALGTGRFSACEFGKKMIEIFGATITPYLCYRRDCTHKLGNSPLTYLYLANTRGISDISLKVNGTRRKQTLVARAP